jgi:hypothetical protein
MSSWMARLVGLVRTEVSRERLSSVFRLERISDLGTALAVTNAFFVVFQLLVTANDFPSSLILTSLKIEATRSSETLDCNTNHKASHPSNHSHIVIVIVTSWSPPWKLQILHSINLLVMCLLWSTNYGFYIPEGGVLHSHRHENLKSYIALTGWPLLRRLNMSLMR